MTQLPGRQGDKPRLLMVDDSKVMRKAATKMLGDRFEVLTAEEGQEGWNQIRHDQTIQVVFTDLSMPELDGYGLLEKIRTSDDPGIANLPVIVVTGAENDDAARERALELGATDFIGKPFNSTDLLARARAHMNYERQRRQLEQQVTIDSLTGLGNKQHFHTRLKQDLAFCERHGHPISLVRFDVDGFNQLFIKAGKDAADEVLRQVGRIIAQIVRKEDTAARTGLARFVVSLPTAQEEGASILANRIIKTVRQTEISWQGKRLPVTLSAGVLQPDPHPGQTPRSVLEELNLVIEHAHNAGGDQVINASDRETSQRLPSKPEPPAESEFPRPPEPSVDEALEMLADGREQEVRPHLGELRRKLQPLLALMAPSDQEDQSSS
jgi:diguanylate cyclase (GGDEF)-like protein